ncbi:18S pre-ribosomal assembly protein gar2-related, putative isoform 1 [Quillaja saponaria]|uniref:18S pre-ribosomal assembly protein gar2-related, putative isoform 1 n=1 Tax=Quillaja saponaria TaxID=32244 RepID=A0AAD7PGF1_QUISA|nr:18S pre-ribosomal assembly protein gar2-related, putative isoform 1 [Quillaja saponaria]
MKLDNDQVFFHPNLGIVPDPVSCESNGNRLDSDRFISGNKKAKEYENRVSVDLKSNEGGLDLSSYEMVAGENLSASGLERSMCIDHLKDDNVDVVRDFVAPVNHSSQAIESFEKSSQQVSHHFQHREPFEKSSDICTDKGITECELPELIVCYKESTDSVVKDICVDEGVPAWDKILFGNDVDENVACTVLPPEKDQNKEMRENNGGIDMPFPDAQDISSEMDSDKMCANQYQANYLMQTGKDATDKLADDVYKELVVLESKILMEVLNLEPSRSSVDMADEIEQDYVQISSEPALSSKAEESTSTSEETNFDSPTLVSAADEPSSGGLVSDHNNQSEIGTTTFHLDTSTPAACERKEFCQVGDRECVDSQNKSEPADLISDAQTVSGRVQHFLGESSFSAIGYRQNGIVAQKEWQKLIGGISGRIGVGGRAFFAVNSKCSFQF